MKKLIMLFFIMITTVSNSNAQEIFKYDSNNSILPESRIKCIAVDSSNTIWLSAGSATYTFVNKDWSKFNSLDGFLVTDIEVSPSNDTWFSLNREYSTIDTLILCLKKTGDWAKLRHDVGLRSPSKMFIENDTTLYLTLYNWWDMQLGEDAVGILKGENFTLLELFQDPYYIFGISSVVPISDDTFMLSSWQGISFFDGDTNIVNNPEIIDTVQWGLTKLNEDIFIYEKRLFQYKDGSYISFLEIDSILADDSSMIKCMNIEGKDILWIGTSNGRLIRYKEGKIVVSKLADKAIIDIVVDKFGNKWFISGNSCFVYNENKIVGIEEEIRSSVPNSFTLEQNYPNPFNPSTTIRYQIPSSSVMLNSIQHLDDEVNVSLKVYDILGREVVTLVNEPKKPGNYEVTFDANHLSSGVYYYRLQGGNSVQSKKMILIK